MKRGNYAFRHLRHAPEENNNNNEKIQELQNQQAELEKQIANQEKNITILEQEKNALQLPKITDREAEFQEILSEIINKKIEFFIKDNHIYSTVKVNRLELIKNARKWWHWPLKIVTFGIWESKEIRKINEDYISRKVYKKLITDERKDLLINIYNNITDLSCKNNELKDKTNKCLNHEDKILSSLVNNSDNNSLLEITPENKSVSASNISLH